MASMFMHGEAPLKMEESFLSKKESEDEVSVWGQDGYQRTKTQSSPNLNEAQTNISTMTDTDKIMADMVKDAFASSK